MAYEKVYSIQDFTPEVAVGIKLPIVGSQGELFQLSYSTEEQVISNLKNLLFTVQGERVMQPLFGTRLREAIFEQNTDLLKERIGNEIYEAVEFWLPYVDISKMSIETVIATGADMEEHGVRIELNIRINGQESEIPITFVVTPTGAFEI